MTPGRRSRRVAALVGILAVEAGCTAPPAADLIAVGRVWTGDSAVPWAQAVVVGGGAITAIGDSATLLRLARSETEILRGAMVVPGFMDDHTHFFQGGFQLGWVDLREAPTPEELVRRIGAHARTLPKGEWILGGDWDHEYWMAAGTPLPDRRWIDSVTPDHPVMVTRYDSHMVLANSLALRLAGIDRATPEVPGGEIVRRRGGEPTGVFRDAAMGLVERAVPRATPAQLDSALARGMAHAASRGVTAVSHVSATWDEVAAFRRARARDAMTLRASIYLQLADWRHAAESLRVHGPGDAWLRVAGVKGMVDGSLGSTTAWFFRPYEDAPQSTGLTVTPVDSIRAWVGAADSAGLQVVVHAIGDRANAVLLDVFDSVATAHGPRDRRFRVEHAQHLRAEEIPRFARLGVLPSMQPYHAIDDGRWAWKRIGPDRIRTTYAFRSLLDAGAGLMFGSDWTVAPIDPLLGIYAAVTRRTLDGQHPEGWVPEEKITVAEALRAYTGANAFGMYLDRVAGWLRLGLQGDLVVLDRDLTRVAPETLGDARVTATVVGGRGGVPAVTGCRWALLLAGGLAGCAGADPEPVAIGDACTLLTAAEAEGFAGHPLVTEPIAADSTSSGCIWWADSTRRVPMVQLTVHWAGGRAVLAQKKQAMALVPAPPGAAPADSVVEPGAVAGLGDEAYFSEVFASLVRRGDRLLELFVTHLPDARAAFLPLARAMLSRL